MSFLLLNWRCRCNNDNDIYSGYRFPILIYKIYFYISAVYIECDSRKEVTFSLLSRARRTKLSASYTIWNRPINHFSELACINFNVLFFSGKACAYQAHHTSLSRNVTPKCLRQDITLIFLNGDLQRRSDVVDSTMV